MHKREDEPTSPPSGADKDAVTASSEPVSPARARAADQIVKRARNGLIRLETRRRYRVLARRFFYALLIAGAIYAVWYFLADDAPIELLKGYWQEIKAKLIPVLYESAA